MPLVSLAEAVRLLKDGTLVAIPTETVYGLAADARRPDAVAKIFSTKGRPSSHPLIAHVRDYQTVALPDPRADLLAERYWPGPLTLVLRRREGGVCKEVSGGRDSLAVRAPNHPLALALIDAVGPLAAPSANRFGQVSPTTAGHVLQSFPELPVLDGGPCSIGVESTIVDLSTEIPALLRPGGLPAEELERYLGPLARHSSTAAPGTLPAHYAPHTRVILSTDPRGLAMELRNNGERVAILPAGPVEDHARRLYSDLRELDTQGYTVIIAEPAIEAGLGAAINDRLRRAAASF